MKNICLKPLAEINCFCELDDCASEVSSRLIKLSKVNSTCTGIFHENKFRNGTEVEFLRVKTMIINLLF